MSVEAFSTTIASLSTLSGMISTAIQYKQHRMQRQEQQQQGRQQQQQQQQQQQPQTDISALALIDHHILVVILANVDKIKARLISALSDPSNTAQAKDAELEIASHAICAELSRIRTLNDQKLPSGDLEKMWISYGCQN